MLWRHFDDWRGWVDCDRGVVLVVGNAEGLGLWAITCRCEVWCLRLVLVYCGLGVGLSSVLVVLVLGVWRLIGLLIWLVGCCGGYLIVCGFGRGLICGCVVWVSEAGTSGCLLAVRLGLGCDG